MILIERPGEPAAETPPEPVVVAAPPATEEVKQPEPIAVAVEPTPVAAPIPVALALSEPVGDRWPWWFWPGVAVTIAVSLLIIAVRLLFFSPFDAPAPPAIVASAREQTPGEPDKVAEAQAAAQQEDVQADDRSKPEDQPLEEPVQQEVDPTPAGESLTASEPSGVPATDSMPQTPPAAVRQEPAVDEIADSSPQAEEVGAVQPPQTTMLRVPPRSVDVDLRLADTIPVIDAKDVPLWAILELISQVSTIPITLDADSLAARGQSAAMPITARLGSGKTADMLTAILEPQGMDYEVREGQLIVGHASSAQTRRVRYTVSDLATDEQELAHLAGLVRRMVRPESWQEAGGRATLATDGGALVVEQTDPGHLAVLVLCEKLRVARGLPIKSRHDPAAFLLTSRHGHAEKMLGHQVTANFGAPQPLQTVVNWLRQTTGATILVDHAALGREGMSEESHCAAVADEEPLSTFLDRLLGSIGLAWRAIDGRTIEITTPAAAATRMHVEFYPVGELARDATAGQALVERIRREVEPQSWGDAATTSAMNFDAPSRTLIVRAPYRTHGQVESLLAALRKN